MENVVRGGLKLKKPLDGGIKKKKKKSKSKEAAGEAGGSAEASSSKQRAQDTKDGDDSSGDERTAYEKKWDQQVKRVDLKNAKTAAEKSHRDKINEFNEKLSNMSEHYDLPRVAGGG
mmetsp:Transcript_2215/g.4922  ORF Transcript_2215/g.4922 Transcript_2215/m.4922 type:complete len:117 (-) Transcript_2215:397-747(-)